MTLSSA
jgi:hypothetical protein